MSKHMLLPIIAVVLAACSGAEDVLENIEDVSVPDQLTGCVLRGENGETCNKAVCVADEETDCKSWVKACKKHEHVADLRDGHNTCERQATAPE